MGGKALQQDAPQWGALPAKGIEGIGAGGLLREAPQQLPPEGLGFLRPSTGLGGKGGLFEADRRQDPAAGVVAPSLAPEPSAALLGRAARLGTEQ